MNILEKSAQYIDKVRVKCLTETVEYEDFPVAATIGKTIFKLDNGYGVVYEESTDFLISVALLLDQPRKGDKILWREVEYEVLAPDNEPVWRYSDPYKTTYRIHSKRVG